MNNLLKNNYVDLVDLLDRMELQYVKTNQDLITLLIKELKQLKEQK